MKHHEAVLSVRYFVSYCFLRKKVFYYCIFLEKYLLLSLSLYCCFLKNTFYRHTKRASLTVFKTSVMEKFE